MSVNKQLEKLTFEVAQLQGVVSSLVAEVKKLQLKPNGITTLRPLLRLIAICFSGTFIWLGVLTSILIK